MGDRYSITDRVDAGGMAEVFRGVAESIQGFKKSVAIKRILPGLVKNEKFVAMFLDEAKLSLFLQHANIVQVFDIGQSDNSYFLVMEFVDGCNLKALIERLKQRDRRLEPAHAIYIMTETCKALNYAHHVESPETGEELGIVHRDISPPNILISKMGEVKVVDFGLAKANSQIESTEPGVVKGKFSYLSPEAASGQEVDARADIFAVGILLWEMLTGRRLFYGDTDYQTVEQVRQARIPSIAALNPNVEQELEAIVRKALARNPAERYQEAADLGDALSQYLFSHRMKVTARDIASLVRDTQMEQMRKRSLAPKESIIDNLIQDEVGKVTSLLDGESPALAQNPGAASLDPASFIDTSAWAADFGLDAGSGGPPALGHGPGPVPADVGGRPGSSGGFGPPPSGAGYSPPPALGGAPNQPRQRTVAPPSTMPPPGHPVHGSPEIEPLQQMLEPDRTGVHDRQDSKSVLIAIVVLVVLVALVGVTLIVFKDRIFGANETPNESQNESVNAGASHVGDAHESRDQPAKLDELSRIVFI